MNKRYCKDCKKLLSKKASYHKYKRCNSCAMKYLFKSKKNHPWFQKKHSKKTKEKIRLKIIKLFKTPTNNPNWKGGKSFEPYDTKFNNTYKESIRMRDGYKCQLCKAPQIEFTEKLCIHHIDYNKMNTTQRNNISLCRKCNSKVNSKRKYWKKYFNKLLEEQYHYVNTTHRKTC